MDKNNYTTGKRRGSLVALFGLILLLSFGCGNPVQHIKEFEPAYSAHLKETKAASTDFLYRIVPYDTLNIKFTYHPENDPKSAISVRPDGHINLEGIGSIKATGLTPEELSKLIAEKSSVRLKDPEVLVSIAQYAPRRVFVGGEVRSPGVVQIVEGMTPLQAIFDRGGFTETAQVNSVVLIRDAISGDPKIGRVDLYKAMENAIPEEITLLPNDVVYVPMTGIGRADLWVKQHIRDLIPGQFLRPPIPGPGMLFR